MAPDQGVYAPASSAGQKGIKSILPKNQCKALEIKSTIITKVLSLELFEPQCPTIQSGVTWGVFRWYAEKQPKKGPERTVRRFSPLGLASAVLMEVSEDWEVGKRYLELDTD